mmetsp:Transcript_84702/g.181493  ORF Transcript_84702/g.181493 Transcript_84702/m.181493 type:complete len:264 (+) Transcript_84702:2516-3307(+)
MHSNLLNRNVAQSIIQSLDIQFGDFKEGCIIKICPPRMAPHRKIRAVDLELQATGRNLGELASEGFAQGPDIRGVVVEVSVLAKERKRPRRRHRVKSITWQLVNLSERRQEGLQPGDNGGHIARVRDAGQVRNRLALWVESDEPIPTCEPCRVLRDMAHVVGHRHGMLGAASIPAFICSTSQALDAIDDVRNVILPGPFAIIHHVDSSIQLLLDDAGELKVAIGRTWQGADMRRANPGPADVCLIECRKFVHRERCHQRPHAR